MKKTVFLSLFVILAMNGFSQKTLMVEKSGTTRHYFYHTGDPVKLRVSALDTLLRGRLWSISDSSVSVAELRPFDVRISDIGSVYKQFSFPKKFGKYMMIGGACFFGAIAVNHLLHNEQVFTNDMFILCGSLIGVGIISFSLHEKRCRTDHGWTIKVLDKTIY